MIHVRDRYHEAASNVMPETNRPVPPMPYGILLSEMAANDSMSVGWSASAETRPTTATAVAIAVSIKFELPIPTCLLGAELAGL